MPHSSTLDLNDVVDRVLASLDGDRETARLALIEALRLTWNSRGAIDIATIETHLSNVMGATAAGPPLKNLNRALRVLDHHTH